MNSQSPGFSSSLFGWLGRAPSSIDGYELPSHAPNRFRKHGSTQSSSSALATESQGPRRTIVSQTSHDTTHRTQRWLQVLVGHMVMVNSFGLIQSFGIFQLRYEVLLKSSPFQVAWIGSFHIFLVFLLGTLSGWAIDRGYYWYCLVVGSVFQVIGLFVAGFSKSSWMTLVFHGLFQGIGHGLMFCPAVTMIAMYFKDSRYKTTAMSLSGCGGATGGMLFPAIAKYTINLIGVKWTLWIMCGVVSFNSLLIAVLAKAQPRDTGHEKISLKRIIDRQAFKEKSYALYVIAMFFVFTGLWIPYFYVRDFSAKALHISRDQSFIVLLNVAEYRAAQDWYQDRYGVQCGGVCVAAGRANGR